MRDERVVIADRRRAGVSMHQIDLELGRMAATVSRELWPGVRLAGGQVRPAVRLADRRREAVARHTRWDLQAAILAVEGQGQSQMLTVEG
jgi:IS30 family transposase